MGGTTSNSATRRERAHSSGSARVPRQAWRTRWGGCPAGFETHDFAVEARPARDQAGCVSGVRSARFPSPWREAVLGLLVPPQSHNEKAPRASEGLSLGEGLGRGARRFPNRVNRDYFGWSELVVGAEE